MADKPYSFRLGDYLDDDIMPKLPKPRLRIPKLPKLKPKKAPASKPKKKSSRAPASKSKKREVQGPPMPPKKKASKLKPAKKQAPKLKSAKSKAPKKAPKLQSAKVAVPTVSASQVEGGGKALDAVMKSRPVSTKVGKMPKNVVLDQLRSTPMQKFQDLGQQEYKPSAAAQQRMALLQQMAMGPRPSPDLSALVHTFDQLGDPITDAWVGKRKGYLEVYQKMRENSAAQDKKSTDMAKMLLKSELGTQATQEKGELAKRQAYFDYQQTILDRQTAIAQNDGSFEGQLKVKQADIAVKNAEARAKQMEALGKIGEQKEKTKTKATLDPGELQKTEQERQKVLAEVQKVLGKKWDFKTEREKQALQRLKNAGTKIANDGKFTDKEIKQLDKDIALIQAEGRLAVAVQEGQNIRYKGENIKLEGNNIRLGGKWREITNEQRRKIQLLINQGKMDELGGLLRNIEATGSQARQTLAAGTTSAIAKDKSAIKKVQEQQKEMRKTLKAKTDEFIRAIEESTDPKKKQAQALAEVAKWRNEQLAKISKDLTEAQQQSERRTITHAANEANRQIMDSIKPTVDKTTLVGAAKKRVAEGLADVEVGKRRRGKAAEVDEALRLIEEGTPLKVEQEQLLNEEATAQKQRISDITAALTKSQEVQKRKTIGRKGLEERFTSHKKTIDALKKLLYEGKVKVATEEQTSAIQESLHQTKAAIDADLKLTESLLSMATANNDIKGKKELKKFESDLQTYQKELQNIMGDKNYNRWLNKQPIELQKLLIQSKNAKLKDGKVPQVYDAHDKKFLEQSGVQMAKDASHARKNFPMYAQTSEQLKEVERALARPGESSRGWGEWFFGLGGLTGEKWRRFGQSIDYKGDKEAIQTKELIRRGTMGEVVKSLRPLLGAQFTRVEGREIKMNVYNEDATDAENRYAIQQFRRGYTLMMKQAEILMDYNPRDPKFDYPTWLKRYNAFHAPGGPASEVHKIFKLDRMDDKNAYFSIRKSPKGDKKLKPAKRKNPYKYKVK